MKEPYWIRRATVDAVHFEQLRQHGGRRGVRDENLLESALARPQQRWSYEPDVDLADLAAAYGFGIAKNHPFIDGNKRTAFVAMALFLDRNGRPLRASQAEATVTMLGIASGAISESDLAAWCRAHSEPTA